MGALIDRLIAASLRHRAIVVGATILLAAAGLWSFATLNTDAFPDLTPNQVLVMIEVPGLSPAEVEQQVTYPMEVAMLGLPRTTDVRSISKVGLSVVTVTFEDAVDLYFARAQVQQRMPDRGAGRRERRGGNAGPAPCFFTGRGARRRGGAASLRRGDTGRPWGSGIRSGDHPEGLKWSGGCAARPSPPRGN